MLSIDGLNATVGDFQREYLYQVNIASWPIAISTAFPGAATFVANADLYMHKFKIPKSSTNPIKILWAGMWAFFDGPQNPEGLTTLSVRCDRKWDAHGFFLAWKNLTGDDTTGAAYLKPLTIGQIEVLMVDVDKTTVLQKSILYNVSVKMIDDIELDKAGEKEVSLNITIHYEKKKTVAGSGTV
jgi:hypothetical protein